MNGAALIVPALLGQAAASLPMATPGALATSGDWTVGCDNARSCRAVALAPEGADDPLLALAITRDAGGTAPARLLLPFPKGTAAGMTLTLDVDGEAVAQVVAPGGEGALALPLDARLAGALAAGNAAVLRDGEGAVAGRASLQGIAAALEHIDAAQGRRGTKTALHEPGKRGAGAVPPAPPLPVIRSPATGGEPPQTLSATDAARLIGADRAACAAPRREMAVKAWRLDAARSLVTVDHPCGNDAYNASSSVFVLDARGRATPARFDAPASTREATTPVNEVASGGWNAATRRMTSFARGGGPGDCGVRRSFAWDGVAFRLAEQAEMSECRGAREFIVTWRAEVRGR